MRRALVVLALVGGIGAACSAFESLPEAQGCDEIPEGGCPGTGASDCTYAACAAIYSCEDGGTGWKLTATCPVHEAGPDVRPPQRDADWDVPQGALGVGCQDLETPPDCSLEYALDCPANECCDCEGIFVCEDGGWDPWGDCEDGGALVMGGGLGRDK
jgi:hypothetical protein